MKVYFDYHRQWGRVMGRITNEIKKHTPDEITYVDAPEEADLQILHMFGTAGSNKDSIKVNDYVVLFECFDTPGEYGTKWVEIFEGAKMVYSFHPLNWIYPHCKMNFLFGPWGVDPTVFYEEPRERIYKCLNTGYVSETECIIESAQAAADHGKTIVHVGGTLPRANELIPKGSYLRCEGITDDQMRQLYSSSEYTCGLRRFEGFELPVLEGALCGSRPIVFNTPYYHWFRDFAIMIPEDNNTKDHLSKVFSTPAKPITIDEKLFIAERFSWERIVHDFWERLL